MKPTIPTSCVLLLAALLLLGTASAQPFVGTNAPGQTTNFAFTLGPTSGSLSNLSLVISNSATAYSYLFLKKGGAASEANFDFAARLAGQTNAINLEVPEFSDNTNYGLRVSTPNASATQGFKVVVTTGRSDLRSAAYPALKPLVFSTTGDLTNTGSGAWHYFQVDVASNLPSGWRVVLSSTNALTPDLYIRRGALPTPYSYDKYSSGQPIDTIIFNSTEATAGTYFIGVYQPSGVSSWAHYTLSAELASVTTLAWDPGTTDSGAQVFTNRSVSGGDYYFSVTTLSTAVGVWRTALSVQSGEADVYLSYGYVPSTASYSYASTRTGSDGFVLSQLGGQFSAGQNWYLLVHATPGAQWTLVTGEAYVQQLPALAADGSSGAAAAIGPEGMRFFKTTITTNTLAWRLGLNGLTNHLYVRKTGAPHPYNSGTYDLNQAGQMLVVPSYLNIGDQYFVGVPGNPGQTLTLDSRQQMVTNLAFNSLTNFSISGYGYVTFRVQVPVQQIAWQITAKPLSGDVNVAVRRDAVPNEFVNDAYSDVAGSTADSVTLVPPTLSDGTFYVTVYGTGPYTCSLTNGMPVITDVDYVFQINNDDPARVGWRFYRVLNTAEQAGTLGWELDLLNQPPGTEIAIRRNAVPGRWNYRNYPYAPETYTQGYVDFSGTAGFLQQPRHQSDIWYIGVYSPALALGAFTLSGSQLTASPLAFDGSGNFSNVANQPSGKLQYFRIDVPANALGWDVRLTNVTSGDPRLVVSRDELPDGLSTHDVNGYYWYPYASSSWPSGAQWLPDYDWTGRPYAASGTNEYGHLLAMGMGNPLQAGTYYVGVLNSTGSGYQNPMSYTLASRGIGTNLAIPVADLAFTNGIASITLPPREAAYYRVTVPTNSPSWKLNLAATLGESLLIVQKDALPNVDAGGSAPTSLVGGRKMQKTANEQYMLMPAYGSSNLQAGTYYVAVVGEGRNPFSSSYTGTNTSSMTLASQGVLAFTNLGTVDPSGATDLGWNDANQGGEIKGFHFTVPPNTLAVEVHLDNRVGNPCMMLRADNQLPDATDYYGNDGGQSTTWSDSSLINIVDPQITNYTLLVQAAYLNGDYPDASYHLRVHAIGQQSLSFDGGRADIANQPAGTWRFFSVSVPANALGWDVRLTNVTSGDPRLVIARGWAPYSLTTQDTNGYYWYPYQQAAWPICDQWAAANDWTGRSYGANGTNEYGHLLAMGMGNPLQPGNYIVGVLSGSGTGSQNPMSYTLLSRGIGSGFAIPVTDLAFTNDTRLSTGLPPREAAYYRVVVPANVPSWKVRLGLNAGEALLAIQKDALPNIAAAGSAPTSLYGGREMQKLGNEHYLFLPPNGQSNIAAGTYYLAVVGEGWNPQGSYTGTNSSDFSLTSFGLLSVSNLGTVDFTGATDIIVTNSQEGGEFAAFKFAVPPNTLSLEVHLENQVGNPWMSLRADAQLPAAYYNNYGTDGGQSVTWNDGSLINIANPAATNYTLLIQAAYLNGGYPDASYRIRIHAIGPQLLSFDGGTSAVTGQPAGTWRFFIVNVPSGPLGWDIRITNVLSGDPRLVVAREQAPNSLTTRDMNGYFWYPYQQASWPTNAQWAADYDWTGYTYGPDGTNEYGHILEMGMGNPLQPGTYYVGVLSGNGVGSQNPMSYTLVSRGIGLDNLIPVTDLAFTNGLRSGANLPPRQAAYYRVAVPTNVPNWKLRLTATSGDSLLAVQKDFLPSVDAGTSPPLNLAGGHKLQKDGSEQYLLLPPQGASNLTAGTYYVLVASEGMNPRPSFAGTNFSSYTLASYGVLGVNNLGAVAAQDLLHTNHLQGGETALYQFSIPSGASAVEVRLDNRAGNPFMTLATGTNAIRPNNNYSYGYDYSYGVSCSWNSPTLITLPNPTATNYSLSVNAADLSGIFPDADFTVHVRQMSTPVLNFAANLNTNGFSNVVSNTLSDGQSAFYQVTIPATNNGQAVIGWKLDLAQTSGTPKVRVRQGQLPDDYNYYDGTSPFAAGEAIIVPTYLTPGLWYVEVRGQGPTSFTLTSSDLLLQRPAWTMPAIGGSVTTPGLPAAGPLFGDTGVDPIGQPLSGDQGTDLEQGNFHYYAITVPPNNIGVLRTRLDAISGDPNLYIRAGAAPTLSHSANGLSGTLYDRACTASIGSEFGNWVPLNGRYENYLTPGTWYLAVQAAGNSNVRYRLRVYTGIVNDLALNSGSYTGQNLMAGDWMYYRVHIPTNAPVNWNVTFGQDLGDVVMYVRDNILPGQYSTTTDYRDWSYDQKNHGPYSSFDTPGSYALTTPPLRPGSTYYLGFRAVSDATFSVSCTTNGGYIDYTNVIPFYSGYFSNSIPSYGTLKLRIDAPADGKRLILNFTNAGALYLYLDQGSAPTRTTSDHWYAQGYYNAYFNQALSTSSWPWQPDCLYFLFVTNTSAQAQPFTLNVDGRNCATDDYDNDGLPDCWELTYWPSIYSFGPNDDPDHDGVSNLDEYLEGTDPTDPHSFHPRLQINATNGSVALSPAGNFTSTPSSFWFTLGQSVQLTAKANTGYNFLQWSGDASGSANPLTVVMNGHSNITAVFGITNQPCADYRFQNNLHSSLGTTLDLTNVAIGNFFTNETVDGFSQTVYRFPQGSGVALLHADAVIPTNVYTMVLYFRLDNVSGWRRLIDFKNPPSDYGLYAVNGYLSFYGAGYSGSTAIPAGSYAQVVLTRDASSNVVAYLNGVQQFSFVDTGYLATLSGLTNQLRFFKDDATEESGGAVARIRLYDKVMPPSQVGLLDHLLPGAALLQFVSPYSWTNGAMSLTLKVTPNFTYAIQASTDLINWITITNVTSPSALVTIVDPQAGKYTRRFYRGKIGQGILLPLSPQFSRPFTTGTILNLPAQITPGFSYRLQGSTNLVYWVDLATNTPQATPFVFTNALNGTLRARFYRLVSP